MRLVKKCQSVFGCMACLISAILAGVSRSGSKLTDINVTLLRISGRSLNIRSIRCRTAAASGQPPTSAHEVYIKETTAILLSVKSNKSTRLPEESSRVWST